MFVATIGTNFGEARMRRVLGFAVVMILAYVPLAGQAGATPPGRDGRLSFAVFGASSDIAVANDDGSGLQLLTHHPAREASYGSSWSPDGRMLAFDVFPPSGGGQIWVMRADGTHKLRVAGLNGSVFDESPAWSPTGRWIMFDRAAGSGYSQLWAVRPDGTGDHRVLAIPGHNLDYAAFSPDGSHIVFTDFLSFQNSLSRLEVARADGSDVRPIPNTLRLEAFTDSWSPNGRWIAFSNHAFHNLSSVFAIHPNGSGLHRITRPGRHLYNDLGPVWSPRGDQLAFQRSPCPGNPAAGCPFDQIAIWVIDANDRHPHTVTHNPNVNYLNPDWGRRP